MVLIRLPVILVAFVAVAPPEKPEPVGNAQVYLVPIGIIPLVPSVGVNVKVNPAQIVVVIGLIAATGFTVTVSVKLAPLLQAVVLGVTVYVAV